MTGMAGNAAGRSYLAGLEPGAIGATEADDATVPRLLRRATLVAEPAPLDRAAAGSTCPFELLAVTFKPSRALESTNAVPKGGR